MWRYVNLALTGVSGERIATIFGVEKIRERGNFLDVVYLQPA
jgi:hypothetical protein